jgi:hypothetical protein
MTLAANAAATAGSLNNIIAALQAAGFQRNGQILSTICAKIDNCLSGTPAQQTSARTWLLAALPPLRDFCSQIGVDVPNAANAATEFTAIIGNL